VDSGGSRIYSKYETSCTVTDMGVSAHRGVGRCMYVHGKDECDVLWQMIPSGKIQCMYVAIIIDGWADTCC
jgi:hypothetical protein